VPSVEEKSDDICAFSLDADEVSGEVVIVNSLSYMLLLMVSEQV
jgi:hypothetical protein